MPHESSRRDKTHALTPVENSTRSTENPSGIWQNLQQRVLDSRHITRYPLIWVLVALLVGACLPLRAWLFIAWGFLLGGSLILLLARYIRGRPASRGLMACTLTLVFLALGSLHTELSKPSRFDELSEIATRKPEPIVAKALVSGSAVWSPNPNYRPNVPTSQEHRTRWDILVTGVRSGVDLWRDVAVNSTLLIDGRIDDLLPGDEILIHGSFRRIYPATNPGNYDYSIVAARENRFVQFAADNRDQIELINSTTRFPFSRLRAQAIRFVDRNLRQRVTNGQSPLAAALVFGQRQQVDWEDQQQLMATGTLHMLAISGMHVEIVALGIAVLCMLFGIEDWKRFVVLAGLCAAYAVLAAAKPPVLRATILVIAFEYARIHGRQARLGNLLPFAGIVLFWAWHANIYNAGVHLSFLAVAAIGIFLFDSKSNLSEDSPIKLLLRENWGLIRRWLHIAWVKLRATCQLSLWVWLITAPLIWWHFHLVSPIAIPLNVLLAIPLAIGLLAGLATGLLGAVPVVGAAAGWVCGCSLEAISQLVAWAETITGGHVWLPSPPLWFVVAYYSVVGGWLLVCGRERRWSLASLLVLLLGAGVGMHAFGPRGFTGISLGTASKQANEDLRITFLDVGHGTSVVIEMPSGHVWVYDAGHMGSSERSHEGIANAIWHIGASRIDMLFVSHADSDHYNAVQGLAQRFSIGKVASTSRFFESEDQPVIDLLQDLREKHVPLETLAAGDYGQLAGVDWRVLHPAEKAWIESDNASSLTLFVEFKETRVLLPGDLEASGLTSLVELPARPCHLLMAPHHGSVTLDPTELLMWCRPEFVLISGNHRANRARVLERYENHVSDVGVTFRDGAIQCRVNESGVATYWRWGRPQGIDGAYETQWHPWRASDN